MAGDVYHVDKTEKSGGCYVSTVVGFVMFLLAVAIAVGVGLIVYFAAGGREVVCNCQVKAQDTTPSQEYMRSECRKMASAGNTDICSACPSAPATTKPTTATTTTPASTTPAPTPEPPQVRVTDVRIPLHLYPVHFDVEIKPNIYEGDPKDFTFDGYVRIQLRCDTPSNNVTLHMNGLGIHNSTLEFGPEPGTATAPSIVKWVWDKDRQFMVIHLDGMLQKDGLYYVKMNYSSPLSDGLFGLYLSSYKKDNQTHYLATTQFQPTDARKAFPCFGEPAIKSFFNITLVRKSHMKSLSNMPIARMDDRGDNWVADVFMMSPKMPVYLLAFIVCDFEFSNVTTPNDVLYRVWARPGSVDQASFALNTGVKVLTHFEDYFGVKFPLPKQDMFAVPDFPASAMENWGLIVYREAVMLYEPGVSTSADKQRLVYVVAHELAHQWFGNLVSPSWWDDLWLNEGFATFVGYSGADFANPDWQMWEQFSLVIHNVFDFDGLVSSHPVFVPVGHPDEIYEIFDAISYEKGASILRMMKFFLGDHTFKTGLMNYLKNLEYGAAFHDDLWNSMTEQARIDGKVMDVKAIMDTWTLQMNYPVVMVTRTGSNRINVTQQRFLRDPDAKDPGKYTSTFGYKWDIPFAFTSSKEIIFNKTDADVTWIKKDQASIEIQDASIPDQSESSSWILGNPMQYGYYRVNYDTQNWLALINQLKTDHTVIHQINRGQIINDAWSLAKAGSLPLDTALQTVDYIEKEMDLIPWKAALKEMAYVKTMLAKSGLYGTFEAVIKMKLDGPFKKLGMNNTGASHIESLTRSELASAACEYGVQSCIDESLKLFRQWMKKPEENPIDPDLKPTVYCAAIASGGVEEWDFAYKQYDMSSVASEKSILLGAMGCSREPWIIQRYLERALNPAQIKKQDALLVFTHVSKNPIGHSLAWDFFVTRWDEILKDYSATLKVFMNLIGDITAPFNTETDLDQLEYFLEKNPEQGFGARAFQQAVEKTKSNIKWMKNSMDTVKAWLAKQKVTPTEEEAKKVTDVRIPLHLYPVYFDVEVKPNMYTDDPKTFTFDGYVRIQLRCDTPSNNVTLHMNRLVIDNATLEFGAETGTATAPSIVNWEWDKDRQFMVIHLDGMLQKDGLYYVKMNYSSPLKDDLAGLYLSSYKRDNRTVYLATTQFQATDARKAFPCFGEPAIKSFFNITLVRKSHMKSLSNMPIARSENRGDNWVADIFQTTPKMPVYLLAFVISDFEYGNATTSNDVLFRAWSRMSSVQQTSYALDTGVTILEHFEDYFSIKFPLPKQDMLAIPDFSAGAMENWGLIIYREDLLLYKPGVSSEDDKQWVARVVSHELAHQWFGNLVSPSWWDDLWLNEGFATYMEYAGVHYAHPDWQMWDQFSFSLQVAFKYDGLISSHPVFVPVGHPDEINEIFDQISYEKGACVIRMMEFFLGPSTFKKALSEYLTSFSYGAAFHDDLWNAMTQQAESEGKSIDVKEIMDTWTLQMNYPVVMVTQTGNDQIKVTQQRFLLDPTAEDPGIYTSDFGYMWEIPFTYTTSKEMMFNKSSDHITWMRKTQSEMHITSSTIPNQSDSSSWILGNPMQYGYYRVNYDTQNWLALINQLKTDHTAIHPVNRAQLVNDAWSLTRAGMLSQEIALQTLEYLDKEMDFVPWKTVSSELAYVRNMLENTGHYGKFEAFMRSKVRGPFNKLGMNSSGVSHIESYAQTQVAAIACEYGVQTCVDEALSLYRQWMKTPKENKIDIELRRTVYCTAIRHGGVEEWDFAFKQYEEITVASDTLLLLGAMGCSREPWILNRYLERAMNPEYVRKQDTFSVFVYVARNPIGQIIARNFVMNNWDQIKASVSGLSYALNRAISEVTSRINTQLGLQQLNTFVASIPDQGANTRAFQQAVEKAQSNIKWMENNMEVVKTWLDKQDTSSKPSTPEKVTDVRLPMHLYPIYFDVEIKPMIYSGVPDDFTFDGYVRIQLRCDTPANNVTLHTNRLVVDNSTLEFGAEPGTPTAPSIIRYDWDKDRQFMVIHLDGMLVQDGLYYVKMNYSSVIKDDFAGVYWSSYRENNQTKYLATTQFQPTDARKAFPCFGEPAIKSFFNITLVRKNHMKSLSNMPQQRTEDRGDNWMADVYETTAKMPVYLVAFVVSEFDSDETITPNGTLFRVWSKPESINQTAYAKQVGVDILTYYEQYYDIPYPLPKQDMVALPDFVSTAMENWGLIVYREKSMLYQQGVSTEHDKQSVAIVIAHELGHMWFGDLVSPAWWDDLWLNEGFATFTEFLGTHQVHPDWRMWDQFSLTLQQVFNFDGLVSSHPLFVPVGHPDEIYEIFDDISYKKGASVIRMMQFFLGEETFRMGLSKYLKRLSYGAAAHDDLWQALNEQAVEDGKTINVKDIMDTWILQMNYPVVHISQTGGDTLRVTQQRYIRDPNAADPGKYTSPFSYKWEIPFTFTSSREKMFHKTDADITWIQKTQPELNVDSLTNLPDQSENSSWILGNPMQYGYYRVNYDQQNWLALINQLKTDHTEIHLINRAQIINDAWNLATAGMLSQDIALQTVEYLDREMEYIPWKAALTELEYMKTMLAKTGAYGAFKMFMKSRVEVPFNTVGMNNTGATHLESFLRAELASSACEFGVQSCIDESLRLFREWMDNEADNPINPDMRRTVYCTAIRHGGVAEWDFAYRQYESSTVAGETAILLMSMGCSQEPWIISRYLERALSGQIRKQNALEVFSHVSTNPIGHSLAYDYFISQWNVIQEEFASSFFAFMQAIGDVTKPFNSQSDLEQLKTFMSNNPDQGTGARAFQQAVEKTQANINWMNRNLHTVITWLKKLGFHTE